MQPSRMALAALALAGALFIACADDSHEQRSREGTLGALDLQLRLPTGAQLNAVTFTITRAGGVVRSDDVSVSQSSSLRFQVGRIAAGTSYQLLLAATTSDGFPCASTPVGFDVAPGGTTLVSASLRCGNTDSSANGGNVRVDVDVTQDPRCAQVDGLSASPRAVVVGNALALAGFATTPDATFAWTVSPPSSGTFSSPSAAAPSFTCNTVGTHAVTLTVTRSAGDAAGCPSATAAVPIVCEPEASSSCGDAVLHPVEECDDGNAVNNDGCSTACQLESCGDGIAQTAEQCDDGNSVNNDGCSVVCLLERCGDGIVHPAEQCDDGNTVSGDGCEPDCTLATLPDGCAICRNTHCRDYLGIDLVAGCFETLNTDFGASPGDPTFIQQCIDFVHCAVQKDCAFSPDRQAAGCYCGSATLDECAGAGPAPDGACIPEIQAAARTTVNADLQLRFTDLSYPLGWAYFLLDCYRSSCSSVGTGDCTEGGSLRCGNGVLDVGEQCDDGNLVSTDSCTAFCTNARCGDRVVGPGEQCDDGNAINGDGCDSNCTLSPRTVCGDGVIEGAEQCDDGNTLASDSCTNLCRNAACGDGIVRTGLEQCDDGNPLNSDGCSNGCQVARCGDGFVYAGVEQCDDGNTVGGDACEADCRVLNGPTCETCRNVQCRNFFGVDLVAGCFEAVNVEFGAPAGDPTFIQQCVDFVSCAQPNQCAFDTNKQAAGCYCGSASIDQCASSGPAPDAPCVAQVQAATRTTVNAEVQLRFTDLSYPAGWAFFLLDCYRINCNSAITGDCTSDTTLCGNAVLDSGEECDDGNFVSTDSCTNICKSARCGDFIVGPGELCDDGNPTNGDGCESDCTLSPPAVCGNGILEGSEQCDDANVVPTDACTATCRNARCGDGIARTGVEQCDDGNDVSNDACTIACQSARCGDGFVHAAVEQCDDGNTVSGDGCEADCTLVDGPTCESCRNANCRDFLGIDLVAGCFESVNPEFGAAAGDPTFLAECSDTVRCARQNDCAYDSAAQAAGCYCGSATIDACAASGPAADAACVPEWQRASRSTANGSIMDRFTDLSYPAGWAYFLLECDRLFCDSPATGDCTVP